MKKDGASTIEESRRTIRLPGSIRFSGCVSAPAVPFSTIGRTKGQNGDWD
jgi:hypothetical protein